MLQSVLDRDLQVGAANIQANHPFLGIPIKLRSLEEHNMRASVREQIIYTYIEKRVQIVSYEKKAPNFG
jgi:hypothetical protein